MEKKENEITQLCVSITGEGGRERYMRNLHEMFDAEPYVLKDDR